MRLFKTFSKNRQVYLDFASSTPLDDSMLKKIPKIRKCVLGTNPSALHKDALKLKGFLESARARIAKVLGAHSDEVIFTSGATESNNLALSGVVQGFLQQGIRHNEINIFISDLEHSAVSLVAKNLNKCGINLVVLKSEEGIINPKDIVVPNEAKAVIVSVMYVNNEIGTVQPIKEVAKQIRKLRKDYPDKEFIFHIDATQAPLYYDLNIPRLGVDMMTLGATKLYCHKGVGMLYKRRGIKVSPIMYGGGQEMGLRPGTEGVELIHEFAYSLEYAQAHRAEAFTHTKLLQEYFETKILQVLPVVKITNLEAQPPSERSPHITHLVLTGIDSELLVIELDARGIAVSSKSACKNEDGSESELLSLLYPHEKLGAIRVSYGRKTTKRELDKTIKAIQSVLRKYQTS